MTELKNLKIIDLSDKPGLSNMGTLCHIQGLEQLYLHGCGLTALPANIGDLKALKILGLVGINLSGKEQARISKALPDCDIKF